MEMQRGLDRDLGPHGFACSSRELFSFTCSLRELLGLVANALFVVCRYAISTLPFTFNSLLAFIFYLCMCMCTTWVQCPRRPEEGAISTGMEVSCSCEPLNVGAENGEPMQKQQVLLTTEFSLQPLLYFLTVIYKSLWKHFKWKFIHTQCNFKCGLWVKRMWTAKIIFVPHRLHPSTGAPSLLTALLAKLLLWKTLRTFKDNFYSCLNINC